MPDLISIHRVLSKRSAEIADIPRVVGDWENQIGVYARDLEARLPELAEYFRIEALPRQERLEAIPHGSPAHKAWTAAYLLLRNLQGFSKKSYAKMYNLGGKELFLGLLQKYEMPKAIRQKVEAAAKYWSKTRAQDAKRGAEVETFKKTMQVYRDHLALAKTAMSGSVDRSTATPDQIKTWTAGPFRLLNTGGFKDKTMEDCVQVVEKAVQLMKSKGLSKVLYGDILISNTVGRNSKVLAFYLPSKDEMFVRANLKGVKQDALHTVIHELGHRLHFKFLSGKKREIALMYMDIGRNSRDLTKDKLQKVLSDPTLLPKPGDKNGFVTQYASKDENENLAEMIAFYCMGGLAPDQVEMLEAIL
jgi:Putative zinc-binding metallo-peptidase